MRLIAFPLAGSGQAPALLAGERVSQLGSTKTFGADVRVIAATNVNSKKQ